MLTGAQEEAAVRCARRLAGISTTSTGRMGQTLAQLATSERVDRAVLDDALRWAHAVVRARTIEALVECGALRRSGPSYDADRDQLAAVRLMLLAIAPDVAARPPTRPAVYVTPPDLLPDLADDVGEIRQLLIELVASARARVCVVTPFFSAVAFREILAPLEAPGIAVELAIYLSLDVAELTRGRALRQVLAQHLPAQRTRFYLHVRPPGALVALPHAKLLLCDGSAGYLGSANMSQHGLREQFEVGVRLGADAVRALEQTLAALTAREVYRVWDEIEDNRHSPWYATEQ